MSSDKYLKLLIWINFIFLSISFYSWVDEYSSWQYGDWLINYQGGFIRRGLIGELFYSLYIFTKIPLDLIILTSVIFFFFLFSLILIKTAKLIGNSKIDYLIFLSPGFFLYPLMNSEIIGRKDILLVLLIGSLVYFKDIFKKNLNLFLICILIIFLTLSHSGFLFYSQYLIVIYLISDIKLNKKFVKSKIYFFIILYLILGSLTNYYSGTQEQVYQICESVKTFSPKDCVNTGQISWLKSNTSHYLIEKLTFDNLTLINHIIIYSISLYLIYFFFFFKIKRSRFQLKKSFLNNITPYKFFLTLLILTLPIFILGRDWGRYIYLSYCCSFFVYVYLTKNNLIVFKNFSTPKFFNKKYLFVLILFFYSFFWTVPFYDAKSLKITLVKPLINLVK